MPRSGRNLVIKGKDGLKVYLTKPAQDNLANKQLIELLAEYLKIKKHQIVIVKGEKSRDKLIKIDAGAAGRQR